MSLSGNTRIKKGCQHLSQTPSHPHFSQQVVIPITAVLTSESSIVILSQSEVENSQYITHCFFYPMSFHFIILNIAIRNNISLYRVQYLFGFQCFILSEFCFLVYKDFKGFLPIVYMQHTSYGYKSKKLFILKTFPDVMSIGK